MERVPPRKRTLVTSFLEIAVGQTREIAVQFLQATNWQLEEAIQLFYVGNGGGAVAAASLGAKAEEGSSDSEEGSGHSSVWEGDSNNASAATSFHDNLVSLHQPPYELMFQGSFDKAKVEASLQDKWLLINLQSIKEFSSHMLNRDTWSNEAVAETIRSNFIFWQVYHDTSDGKKVWTYYDLVSIPSILLIDPITGQKLCAWSGMVQPERLLEDLMLYMEKGSQDHLFARPNKRPRKSIETQSQAHKSQTLEEDEQVRQAITASLGHHKDPLAATTDNEEPEIVKENVKSSNEKWPSYPLLPEEPKSSKGLTCRVGIRLPDGRRVQRNFLLADEIQLLWSFCSSQLDEEAKTRSFRFTQAIPGASKSLEYDNSLTFEESGVSNSLMTFIWE